MPSLKTMPCDVLERMMSPSCILMLLSSSLSHSDAHRLALVVIRDKNVVIRDKNNEISRLREELNYLMFANKVNDACTTNRYTTDLDDILNN